MKRINFIYIPVSIIFLIIVFKIALLSAKNELEEVKKDYVKTQILSKSLFDLKEAYTNKSKIKNMINKILKDEYLKSLNIKQEYKRTSIILSSVSINGQGLSILMGKILNKSCNIKDFRIDTLSDKDVSFNLEIKW